MKDTLQGSDQLTALREVFARAAVGDFSVPLDIPDEENEYAELYAGVSIMLDVINRQLLELREHAFREESLNRTKSEFVALVAHQLRNPLSAVNWSAMELSSLPLDKKARQSVTRIEAAVSQMTWLIDRILALSKIEMGTVRIAPKVTDAVQTVRAIAQRMTPLAGDKGIVFVEKADPPAIVFPIDVSILSLILENLLSNAIRYTPSKGTVTVTVREELQRVVFEVSDTGYGIPVSDQPYVFAKLFRSERAAQLAPEGAGIGLYMVKAIVEEAGGEIRFTSEEGKGTSFFVSFPLSGMRAKEGDVRI